MSTRVPLVAIVAAYNEERTIRCCLEHLIAEGASVVLVDNESTDRTLEIARSFVGRGVLGIETLPRCGEFALREQMRLKEKIARRSRAEWILHADADEIHVSPRDGERLVDALSRVSRDGYNAVNFAEFTFVPTREDPDHDHERYLETMRSYYWFRPPLEHYAVRAWKPSWWRRVDLVKTGGHQARFLGRRIAPEAFLMRHYPYLSRDHAIEKYARRRFAEDEVRDGWHGWRASLCEDAVELASSDELSRWDPATPTAISRANARTRHALALSVERELGAT